MWQPQRHKLCPLSITCLASATTTSDPSDPGLCLEAGLSHACPLIPLRAPSPPPVAFWTECSVWTDCWAGGPGGRRPWRRRPAGRWQEWGFQSRVFCCFKFSNHRNIRSFILSQRKWKYDLHLTIYGPNFIDIWYFYHESDRYVFSFPLRSC